MQEVSRRAVVFTAASAVLVVKTTAAYAQLVDKPLLASIARAYELQNFAVAADVDKEFVAFVEKDFFARQATVLAASASKAFDSPEAAQTYLNTLAGIQVTGIPPSHFEKASIQAQIQVVAFVSAEKVALVPNVSDIQPIGVPVVEPVEPKTEDTDFSVILDIVLQTMGIFEGKALSDELLKDQDVANLLKEIAPSIKDKDWKSLIKLAEKALGIVIASNAIKLYSRRLAFRLSLRCVPIAGWAYVAAAFVIAVKANYHRFSFA